MKFTRQGKIKIVYIENGEFTKTFDFVNCSYDNNVFT